MSITEINDYLAIGSGSDVAKGVLYATQDQNPFDRIVTSIDAAADSTLFVDDGLDILMTETRPSDKKEIAAALGFELKDVEKALQELSQETSEEAATEPKEKKSKKSKTKKK